MSDAITYLVCHDTAYHYDQKVGESRQLLRLTPRHLPEQALLAHQLRMDPVPAYTRRFVDAHGNIAHMIQLESGHESLLIRAQSRITRFVQLLPDPQDSPPWESVREGLLYRAGRARSPEELHACAHLHESSHVRLKREFADYALANFRSKTPLLQGCADLMGRIFEEFRFDPEATDISTPVTEVFEKKRGVCQDFAHFMLSCLRSIGLAARYVSGYILTHPPKGQPRLIGADATHAWVSVFCPGLGWQEFDPTNALRPTHEHIVLAYGRDFSDVSPLRGVILGGGGHEPEIAVSMLPSHEKGLEEALKWTWEAGEGVIEEAIIEIC
jgi:transglutaminase-like putative cysteine protease